MNKDYGNSEYAYVPKDPTPLKNRNTSSSSGRDKSSTHSVQIHTTNAYRKGIDKENKVNNHKRMELPYLCISSYQIQFLVKGTRSIKTKQCVFESASRQRNNS